MTSIHRPRSLAGSERRCPRGYVVTLPGHVYGLVGRTYRAAFGPILTESSRRD